MEVKKNKPTVGSWVRVMKTEDSGDAGYIGLSGMVVAVLDESWFDCFSVPARLKVRIGSHYVWCSENQVQLVTSEEQKASKPEATAHKFKVGDTVRVTNNPPAHLSRSSDDVLWISEMNRYCGHLYRIKGVYERGYILNGPWDILFSEEWLEPASFDKPKPSPKRTIVIEITDDGADAKYIVDKKILNAVSVKRHKDDKPDDRMAAHYAVGKLFGKNVRLDDALDVDALKMARYDCMIARKRLDEISKVLEPFGNLK